jgi:hypothetical protein
VTPTVKDRSPRITRKVTSKIGIPDLRQAQESRLHRTYPRPRQLGGAVLTARSGLDARCEPQSTRIGSLSVRE